MSKYITPETKMYGKLKGKHTFYRNKHFKKNGTITSHRVLQAVVPDGTICEITKTTEDKMHLVLKYDDPTDNKTKYLHYCMHAYGDKIEIIEGE